MIGEKLAGRYEIIGELGRGGMGVVYVARDPLLDRDVAVKLVPPTLLTPETEERLRREARLAAALDHPGIVPVHDIGNHEGGLFFVMPVVKGTTLRDRLDAGRLRLGEILDIIIQVARALDYSHERGILHRDIKPENVMLTENAGGLRVRVMDFGLARYSVDARLTRTGALVGTMRYLSPEQVAEGTLDARSDLYALGTVLYECLAGEPPFKGEAHAILYRIAYEHPRSLRGLGLAIPEALDEIVLRCLSKDPGDRPGSADELADALELIRTELTESDRLTQVSGAPRSARHVAPTEIPFTGRTREFSELQRRLQTALDGECQLVLLGGQVGVGKSRLVLELELLLRSREIRSLHGRFIEMDRGFPYYGFCEVIQDYFRSKEDESSSSREIPDFSDLAPELLAFFPVLQEIDALRQSVQPEARTPSVATSTEDRTQVFELLARTLVRLADSQPLVLLLEDLHQAGVSLDALEYIVRRLGPTPTLIVCTYRSDDLDKHHPLVRLMDGFRGDRHFCALHLQPFTASEHRTFVRRMMGGLMISDELARQLFEATEGNPFFTKELIRSLLDAGTIAKDGTGSWHLSGDRDISSGELPVTIQQAVERRIEGLSPELQEVLATAAVLGRSFSFRDFELLLGDDAEVEGSIEQLIQKGILEDVRRSREDRLAFCSGIVRDVIYGSLTRRRRRSLHRRHAKQLEGRYANRQDRVLPQLLLHYAQGDVAEKAVLFGLAAARQSLDSFSPQAAIKALQVVLEFQDDERWAEDPSAEAEAYELLARAHRMAGSMETALKMASKSVEHLEAARVPERQAAALLLAAEIAWEGRFIDESTRWVARALHVSEENSPPDVRRRILGLAATLANLRGEYHRGLQFIEEARTLDASVPGEEDVPPGGKLVACLTKPVKHFDPVVAATNEEREILTNVFETLLATDEVGSLVPHLCEGYEVLDEGRAIRLALRRDARFHDGTPVDAASVQASLERAMAGERSHLVAAFAALDQGGQIVVEDSLHLRLDLGVRLPIFPALLTDPQTAVVRATDQGIFGTGPFTMERVEGQTVLLRRWDQGWHDPKPLLDELEFRANLTSAEIAHGLTAGEVDVGRALLPDDLERLRRDPRFMRGLVETPRTRSHFLLFNEKGPLSRNVHLRRALVGVLRVHDLVWRTLGRLVQPATGLIPPGLLGHDPGRRAHPISLDEARHLIAQAGLAPPLELRAAVHPVFDDQYKGLFDAIRSIWSELGIEVTAETKDMGQFLAAKEQSEGLDFIVPRWGADYQDADNFTYGLLHTTAGQYRHYYCSSGVDELVERARTEPAPRHRRAIYRRLEKHLLDLAIVLPLFHDLDYRLQNARVRRLRLRSSPPFVNYERIGKVTTPSTSILRETAQATLHVPLAGVAPVLDPAGARGRAAFEVVANVFETVTHLTEGARVGPWLAASFQREENGRRFRFSLRESCRFHDGRRLGARDVRASWERLLASGSPDARVLAPIVGALDVIQGRTRELSGFTVVSHGEFTVDLDPPFELFPMLLTHPSTAVMPEALGEETDRPPIGTGPFRVVHAASDRIVLEAHRDYWRPGHPASDGLVFHCQVDSKIIAKEFRAGRFTVAMDLPSADLEVLRYDANLAAGYRESPALTTAFIQFNTRQWPLADPNVRRALANAWGAQEVVSRAFPRVGVPASGIIPPGLSGHEVAGRRLTSTVPPPVARPLPMELTAAVLPVPGGLYERVAEAAFEGLAAQGVAVKRVNDDARGFYMAVESGSVDLVVMRWHAEYPDADSFVHGLFDAKVGVLRAFFSSPEVDAVIQEGRTTTDPERRHEIYRQFERELLQQSVVLPLFHEQIYCFGRPELTGLRLTFSAPVVAYDELRVR